ncbi:hypothetical protein BCR35DRAFT_351146 [Leucosporidium creatinivorum]|uniref:F-box domain-containing protein n=1 Tax=Leucosporidium creatinivorum TaxID=106004 RepID=A0A1Y2FXT3_9BASI|nr:hypothetical protein BCR35DRAFT_351146 [Leucosporidium creatinivorum]
MAKNDSVEQAEQGTSSSSIASQLPVDIIYGILEAISTISPAEATHTYLSLALVSSSWREPAQLHLFRRPYLPSPPLSNSPSPSLNPLRTYPRLVLLKETLQSHPHLAASVQSLSLGLWTTNIKREAAHDRRLSSHLAVEILKLCPSLCPNLRELSWPGVVRFDKAEAAQALRHLPGIEVLHFGEGSQKSDADPWIINLDAAVREEWGSARWSIKEVGEMMEHWPRLRKVVLGERMTSRSEGEAGEYSTDVGWNCELKSFELALGRHSALPKGELRRLLRGSKESLRHLKVTEHQLLPGELIDYLSTAGSRLTHLSTNTNDLHTLSDLLPPIELHCNSLRYLSIGSIVPPGLCLLCLASHSALESVKLKWSNRIFHTSIDEVFESVGGEVEKFEHLRKVEVELLHYRQAMGYSEKDEIETRIWRGGEWVRGYEGGWRPGDVEVIVRPR